MKVSMTTSSFGKVDSRGLDLLKSKGYEVELNPYGRKLKDHETVEFLKNTDALLAGLENLTLPVLEKLPKLKVISRVGVGMDNIDLLAAKNLGIEVINTAEGIADSVAEITLGAALCLSRSLLESNSRMKKREWVKSFSNGLKNTPVLIIGFGRIGQRVSELFQAFQSEVMICDPYTKDSKGFPLVELDEGLQKAKIVTLHASGKDQILGSREIQMMPKGAIVLNCARGGLVDEEVLCEALEAGHLGSVWMDVFGEEPYQGPLCDVDQALLTPHISTYSLQARGLLELSASRNLVRAIDSLSTVNLNRNLGNSHGIDPREEKVIGTK